MRNEPVRAFHLRFGSHELIESFKQFIEKVLVPKGINHLIIECNTSFVFETHPEITAGTLTKQDAREITAVCKQNGIRVIPLFQCLGHQGWGGAPNSILKAYPEFDETPHISVEAKWPDFFCRSWCPLHPEVNDLVFELMDELIEAFETDAFHVGMDEVYEIADDHCPRCKGKERSELFAKAVNDMYGYIVEKRGLQMFMWADRLNDSEKTGYNPWEGDTFGTHKAISAIPKDIVLMDWHYDKLDSYPSVTIFLENGFSVIPSCWYKTEAALDLLKESERQANETAVSEKLQGMAITSWNQWDKEAFEKFMSMTADPVSEDNEIGELDELYRTLGIITGKLSE
ncbi:family 20 glycosylhydrolase [Rossellomorea sp. BNER]|uniref:family 20 glycosylhydrolase n=1 Tax=Rossellomorea sp. BNER TaxID=2962031 RepID=UPI003AF281C4|nr:family 20 glycosylhydrolase [Rossellomorea sp. BNER]